MYVKKLNTLIARRLKLTFIMIMFRIIIN